VQGKKRKFSMRRYFIAILSGAALAIIGSAPAVMFAEDVSQGKAAGTPAATSPEVATDPLPCLAAITANDDDTIISRCDALIGNEKNTLPDRIRAVLARAAAYDRKQQYDRAIADYDTALQLDPAQADAFNHRGEIWRKKGDRPHALADFGAAIRLNPEHSAARANYKSLAQELELLGAQMAVGNRPSFDCATAKRPVEQAICTDPGLAKLDRDINEVFVRVIADQPNRRAALALTEQQRDFIAKRNASFGKRGYDLRVAMEARLKALMGIDAAHAKYARSRRVGKGAKRRAHHLDSGQTMIGGHTIGRALARPMALPTLRRA
jgi:tetratricopeptide (TPR) repeat protein